MGNMGRSVRTVGPMLLLGLSGLATAGAVDSGLTLNATGGAVVAQLPAETGSNNGAACAVVASGGDQAGTWTAAFAFDALTGRLVWFAAGANDRKGQVVLGGANVSAKSSLAGTAVVLDAVAGFRTSPVTVDVDVDGESTRETASLDIASSPLGAFAVRGRSVSGRAAVGRGTLRVRATAPDGDVLVDRTQPADLWIGIGRTTIRIDPAD